jgi:hypothetical protein
MDLGVDLHDFSRPPGGDELLGLLEGLTLAALKADLYDAVACGGRLDHRPAFANVVGQRLFAIDVQALFQRGDEDQRMPVRGRADDHRVQSVQFEQILIELEGLRTCCLEFLQGVGTVLEMLRVDVAHGHDLDAARLQGRSGVGHAVSADPDDAELQRRALVAGVGPAAQGEGTRDGGAEEGSAIGLHGILQRLNGLVSG